MPTYDKRHWDKTIPKEVSELIARMIDEDCVFPTGTAEKAANQLLKKALKVGREDEFKNAMKVWKNLHNVSQEVIWQWFNGVFIGAKSGGGSKHKSRKRRGPYR